MSTNPSDDKTGQILDLLLELLEERRRARVTPPSTPPPSTMPTHGRGRSAGAPRSEPPVVEQPAAAPPPPAPGPPPVVGQPAAAPSSGAPKPPTTPVPPPAYTGSRTEMPRTIWRMALAIILLVILAQAPIDFARLNRLVGADGTGAQVEVLRAAEGMLLRGSGAPVYRIENGQKRWITTLEALLYYGYRTGAVRPVSDAYLAQFPDGPPIYVLLKCPYSPHIYALDVVELGSTQRVRRWIKDIGTFEAEGFRWEMVDETRCDLLLRVPDGTPFPADAGPAPSP